MHQWQSSFAKKDVKQDRLLHHRRTVFSVRDTFNRPCSALRQLTKPGQTAIIVNALSSQTSANSYYYIPTNGNPIEPILLCSQSRRRAVHFMGNAGECLAFGPNKRQADQLINNANQRCRNIQDERQGPVRETIGNQEFPAFWLWSFRTSASSTSGTTPKDISSRSIAIIRCTRYEDITWNLSTGSVMSRYVMENYWDWFPENLHTRKNPFQLKYFLQLPVIP